jgi:hypothetical protein
MPISMFERRVRLFFSLIVALSVAPFAVSGAAAQDNGANEPDTLAAKIARADSARARLVQPPGEYRGIGAMDVIRVPFQLFGGGLALALAGVGGTYYVLDKVLITPFQDASAALEKVDVDVDVGGLGSRSWPGLIFRYNGLSPFYAELGHSLRNYQHYSAGLDWNVGGGFALGAAGTYDRLRQPHFWGIGPDTRYENRADYSQDITDFTGTIRWADSITGLSLSAEGGWEKSITGRGTDDSYLDVQDQFVPWLFGLDTSVQFARFGGSAEVDLTDLPNLLLRGMQASLAWHHYEGVDGTVSSFEHVEGDARFFIPVNKRSTLALRVLAEEHFAVSGMGVPFTHMARLGDDRGLRGYSGRRFRDLAAAAGTMEWRYEAYWHPGFPDMRIDGFTFVDAGTVGPSLSALDGSTLHVTPGIGLRFLQAGKSRGEVYVGFGGDKLRGGFQIGSTF